MTSLSPIVDPRVCLEVYYKAVTGEVGNPEISRLFDGKISRTTIMKIKKKALQVMIEKDMPHFRSERVNIEALFEVLGLNVDKLKRSERALRKLERQNESL